jgi:hypothetical protein
VNLRKILSFVLALGLAGFFVADFLQGDELGMAGAAIGFAACCWALLS